MFNFKFSLGCEGWRVNLVGVLGRDWERVGILEVGRVDLLVVWFGVVVFIFEFGVFGCRVGTVNVYFIGGGRNEGIT